MLTKKQVLEIFKDDVLPSVKRKYEKDGKPDLPARREAWNDFTDFLMKDGQISKSQYEKWTNPF